MGEKTPLCCTSSEGGDGLVEGQSSPPSCISSKGGGVGRKETLPSRILSEEGGWMAISHSKGGDGAG